MPFLKSLVTKQVPDVRPVIRHFKLAQQPPDAAQQTGGSSFETRRDYTTR
jgi:hypothetical protein